MAYLMSLKTVINLHANPEGFYFEGESNILFASLDYSLSQ